jgi:hypothetical protein
MVLEHDFGISELWFDPGTGLEMVLEHDFGISGLWFDPGTGLEMVLRRIFFQYSNFPPPAIIPPMLRTPLQFCAPDISVT